MTKLPGSVVLTIRGINPRNRKFKFVHAAREIAKALNIPYEIIKARKVHGVEPYLYRFQEELAARWTNFYQSILMGVYRGLVDALDLPPVETETIRKAINDDIMRHRGKIVYNPETGQPVSKKEFDALVESITKFLNRKTAKAGGKMILQAKVAGRLLRRLSRYMKNVELEKLTLDTLEYKGKSFDWISDSIKNMKNAMGDDLTRWEQARFQATMDWAAQKVTRIDSEAREEIKDTLLNGIIEHRSKSQVSQDLFNRLAGKNRDWKRIADTEIVNASNLAGIQEEVHKRPEGKKLYLKRFELPGCCEKCEKINGMVVLWSNTPLADERIKDPNAKIAIWEGKQQDKKMTTVVPGTLHPNCRGGWIPWDAQVDSKVDAMMARLNRKSEIWDEAVSQAREEYKGKGIKKPDDETPGYVDRINELYREKLGEG